MESQNFKEQINELHIKDIEHKKTEQIDRKKARVIRNKKIRKRNRWIEEKLG